VEFRLRQQRDGAHMDKKNIGIDARSVGVERSSAMAIGSSESWMYSESGEY
jgi:hypothetical protein